MLNNINPQINTIIFGTDGWRGLLDTEVNAAGIRRVATAFVLWLKEKARFNRVVVGYDSRRNSPEFASLFASILYEHGMEVLLSDRVVPTPVVSFTCRYRECDAGVMITASHNPAEYNGIKFKASGGSPFATEETAIVESFLPADVPAAHYTKVEPDNLMQDYLNHIRSLIDFSAIAESGIQVAVDSMSGAGATIIEELLAEHGIPCSTIFGVPAKDFSGRLAEPVERNLMPLQDYLRNSGDFSLGLATDGDADRLGVMTGSGKWMNIQEVILYLAEYSLQKAGGNGCLVKTASVTDLLLNLFSKCDVSDVQVGFKYVAEAMLETNAVFGAEESGGFGFREHLPERDGIYSGLVFLEMLAKSGYNQLDDFISAKRLALGQMYYDRVDTPCHSPSRHSVLPALAANPPAILLNFIVKDITTYHSSRGQINGLKFRLEGNPRWLLLRVSETEPIVRVYAEGRSDDEVRRLLNVGNNFFSNL
jgi:phosphomannomutase